MAQFVGRLTALKVLRTKTPGMHADGAADSDEVAH